MSMTGKVAQNENRKKLVAKYRTKYEALKETLRDPKTSNQARAEARAQLQAIPRNASPVRVRNRCLLTGRARGYYRKFGMSRIMLRKHALQGDVPGVTKSSW